MRLFISGSECFIYKMGWWSSRATIPTKFCQWSQSTKIYTFVDSQKSHSTCHKNMSNLNDIELFHEVWHVCIRISQTMMTNFWRQEGHYKSARFWPQNMNLFDMSRSSFAFWALRYPKGSKYSLISKFCYFANAKFVLFKIALLQSSHNLAKCYSVSLRIQYQVAKIRFIKY